jgi:hypothetical protein
MEQGYSTLSNGPSVRTTHRRVTPHICLHGCLSVCGRTGFVYVSLSILHTLDIAVAYKLVKTLGGCLPYSFTERSDFRDRLPTSRNLY